jgi:pyrroline-5-carboxylate reductase
VTSSEPTYGVIGVGSIAAAMVVGWCDGVTDAPQVVLSPRSTARSAELASRFATVRVAGDNQAVVDAADVVVVCLLPANAAEVLSGLSFRQDQAVVSAVAGIDVAHLREVVAPATRVARSVPLPAVATRDSVTPVHPGGPAVEELFARLGGSLVVDDERAFESIAAASATVAAYFGYLGAVAGWLGSRGIPEDGARRYVAATFAALAGELGAPDPDFEALADAHATPGGLNEQFARDLGDAGVYDAVRDGLDAILVRLVGHAD